MPRTRSEQLRVAIDARTLSPKRTGVNTTVANLLQEVCPQAPGSRLLLVMRPGAVRPALPEARDDYRMVLVRRFPRWDPETKAVLDDPRVRDRVTVLPFVRDEVVRALYCRASVFLFPSWVEGFGLPILEARACDCPVLTANRSAPAEVAADAALTADPFDVDALADGLRRLDVDAALREELVARGRERLKAFSWSAAAAQTLQVYSRAAHA